VIFLEYGWFRIALMTAVAFTGLACAGQAPLPITQFVLDRGDETLAIEPYAPNIVRVTLSLKKEEALRGPGYGIIANSSYDGWSQRDTPHGARFTSSRLIVDIEGLRKPAPSVVPRRGGLNSQTDIAKFFNGSAPGAHVTVSTQDGEKLLEMRGWGMAVLNYKDGDTELKYDRRPSDPTFYEVSASFASPPDEHYYGLGQNQEGYLDHRGHVVHSWHDYDAPAGASVGVPFLVTNKGYGLIWDNPSKTTIAAGFNEGTRWTSQVGRRISYFVIAGKTTDEIYQGYRLLTGSAPLLTKGTYGFIQCKQRYSTQAELLAVAKGYRERHLPIDVLVVDWFYYTKMGQMDLNREAWPDPAAMNKELHEMGFQTMISVWPRFVKDSRYYDLILKNGWFEHLADGTPTNGLPYDRAGSDIDTTNPEAAKWYWGITRDQILSKGFDSIWADETEPDLPPNGSYFHVGPGTEFFNVYPLFHTAAFYDGFRRDEKQRAVILARDAYLGAQHNGAMFWSSDIAPLWDVLKRQVPTGLDFVASGMPYWSNDVGGWQYLPGQHHPAKPPLLDPSDARDNVGGYDDYPELYTRWFEYGAFQPIFRTHGSRRYNEVWSYGRQAEPILEKYLRLRYELLPYTYSQAYRSYLTGAPYMRALFMDFPDDGKVADIGDEYMYGPAFLVAPVTEQGATSRMVYLPAGTDWYNYWTNEKVHGGQSIQVSAPIDVLPLFVKAGSIVPTGEQIDSTAQQQKIKQVKVYAGANAEFSLYDDDGLTYAYESGQGKVTQLHWDDAAGRLSQQGEARWSGNDSEIVQVIGK
jgi:alpha-D-xyloside xylohydrolase